MFNYKTKIKSITNNFASCGIYFNTIKAFKSNNSVNHKTFLKKKAHIHYQHIYFNLSWIFLQ